MCLGIPGRVIARDAAPPDVAEVDVAGATRRIMVGILDGPPLEPGDWILIHAGVAMQRIDAETARRQLEVLGEYTGGPTDLDALDPFAAREPSR